MRENPIGIDTAKPRLSWRISAAEDAYNISQSAYRILAATSPDLLKTGQADLWDSRRQATSDTLQIPYDGKPLKSNQKVWWTVRTWDQDGHPSPWTEPTYWTMGLLDPNDWHGKWIGTEVPDKEQKKHPIETAKWIWGTEAQDALDEGTTAGKPAANAERYFRMEFTAPADIQPETARVAVLADNKAEIFLNGKLIGSHDDWQVLKFLKPGSVLKPGAVNLLNIKVVNKGTTANAAGLIAAIEIARDNGEQFILTTNDQWSVSRTPSGAGWPADWSAGADEDAPWETARVLGKWGMVPWHKVRRGQHPILPIFRKEFTLDKPVRRAVTHISGLGHYVLSINGKKVGDHYLDPPWSVYEKTVYYNSFDVTDALANDNAIGVMLGKGFYNTAGDRRIHGSYAERPLALILQTNIEFEDGSTTRIVTDASWKWTSGPLTHNSILGGSDYDARLLPDSWDRVGFDDSAWQPARFTEKPAGKLTAAAAPPMRTFQEMAPVSIEEPEPGHYVYDFGQNASAAPRLKVKGPAGSTIKLTWAEQRKGQDPYTNNGKGVVDQSGIGHGYVTYTLRGDDQDEEWFSRLFYTGYQYLELTGGVPESFPNPDNLPVVKKITSVHVRTDQPQVGTFKTSNQMFNRIDNMIDWAVRSNFGHVFTDCPTREKLGWLEVPWLMWASVASRYDIGPYAEKISTDIRDSQLPSGQILTVAPSYPDFGGGFHYTPEWGAAGVFLPWDLYEWYGDRRALEENYDMMRGFVDYMEETSTDFIAAPGLGDWYDYGHGERLGASRFTPTDLTATAVFAGCADIVSSSAAILNRPADQQKYARLAANVREAFNKKFRTGPGAYQNNGSPQTAHAMALVLDIVPENERAAAAQAIVDDLKQRDWQQTSGDIGYRFLINALSQTGHSDAIYKILARDKIGSYAYLVNSGWTSLPEAWNANPTSSMNHCMLGHIQEWFTQHLLGIAPAQGSVGFNTIAIQPTPGDGVTSASGTLESPRGLISLAWEQTDDTLTCEFSIPANTTALVRLPVSQGAAITQNGKSVSADQRLPRDGDREVIRVSSGHYKFVAQR